VLSGSSGCPASSLSSFPSIYSYHPRCGWRAAWSMMV
jgi:hypothetical protein